MNEAIYFGLCKDYVCCIHRYITTDILIASRMNECVMIYVKDPGI